MGPVGRGSAVRAAQVAGCSRERRGALVLAVPRPPPDPSTATAAVQDERWPNPFPWLQILVLGFAWLLAVAIELSPAGLLNAIAADLNISVVAVGTMTTFYALGNALLVLPLTALAIRFARRTALAVVMIVFVASNLVVALAPTIVVADAGRFIGGASYGVICTLFPAVVVRIAGPRHAGKAITVVFAATSLGTALGAPRLPDRQCSRLARHPPRRGHPRLRRRVLMSFLVPKTRGSDRKPLTLAQTARLPGVLRVAIGWSLVMLAHFVVLTYIEGYFTNLGLARLRHRRDPVSDRPRRDRRHTAHRAHLQPTLSR
jgi:MFS family permease